MYLPSLPWQRVVGKMTQKKGGVLRSGRRRKGTIRINHHAGPFRSGRFGFEARFLSKKLVLSIPSDFFDDLSHFGWNLTRHVFPMCFRNIWSLYIYICFLMLSVFMLSLVILSNVSPEIGEKTLNWNSPIWLKQQEWQVYSWLVVSSMFIFHFIYGMSSFPLTKSYFSRWLLHHQPVIVYSVLKMVIAPPTSYSL